MSAQDARGQERRAISHRTYLQEESACKSNALGVVAWRVDLASREMRDGFTRVGFDPDNF